MRNRFQWSFVVAVGVLVFATPRPTHAATIADALKEFDPGTGKARDTNTVYQLTGIVSARTKLPNGNVLAYVQRVSEVGLPVLLSKTDALSIVPRTEITFSCRWNQGPLGSAVLAVTEKSVGIVATNKAFGAAEPLGAAAFKDATAYAGRYVQLTNVSFSGAKFDDSGRPVVKGEAGAVSLLVSGELKNREVPSGAINVFGVPVKVDEAWRLLASRFLSVSNKANLALAMKHTCITCHNPDTKMVGPAYRDVAARYKDAPEARGMLIQQIEKGGSGKWGPILMPALGSKVPPADREVLIDWVLGYRWDALLAE